VTLRQQHGLAALLIGAHLLLAAAYSVVVPLGEAPDEADHWAYVVYLARERQLPVGPRVTQSKHPPLYHIGAALVAGPAGPAFDFLRANPDVQFAPPAPSVGDGVGDWSPNFFIHTSLEDWPWRNGVLAFHLARLWSVLLSTGTVAALYGLMRAAFPQRPMWALTATGFLAFLPQFAFIGGAINNDNAAALCGTLALWGGLAIYRAGGRLRAGWWTPLALGAGFLSKVSTVALWPVVGLAILVGGWRSTKVDHPSGTGEQLSIDNFRPSCVVNRRSLINLALVFLPALLIAAPWLVRNWWLYGDPLALDLARQTVDERLAPWTLADTMWLLRGWFRSSWGAFGAIGHMALSDWMHGVAALLLLASGVGWVRLWVYRRVERWVLALLLLAVVSTAAAIWRYSLVALGTDQGRLLYPAVGALAALLVAGLFGCLPQRWAVMRTEIGMGATLLLALMGLNAYSLFGLIGPAFAPPAAPPAAERAQWSAPAPIEYGELHLIGWRLEDDPVLYWRAATAPATDWRRVVRIVAEDGTLVWDWTRSPGRGRYATDRWPAGATVRDVYRVRWPDWAGSGRYRVEVGVRPFGGDLVRPVQNGTALGEDGHRFALLGWLERE